MKHYIISISIFLVTFTISAQYTKTGILRDLEKNDIANQDTGLTATLKSSSRLFGEKDDLTTVILIVPSGSEVPVLEADSTYLHVIYDEVEGYIFRRHAVLQEIINNPVPAAEIKEIPVQQQQTRQSQQPQVRQESRFSILENKYGSSMAAKLNSGKIWKGMTSEMVSDSWGNPQKINRVISGNVIKEEWIYRNTWLYLENDRLTEWGPIRNK